VLVLVAVSLVVLPVEMVVVLVAVTLVRIDVKVVVLVSGSVPAVVVVVDTVFVTCGGSVIAASALVAVKVEPMLVVALVELVVVSDEVTVVEEVVLTVGVRTVTTT